MSGDAIDLALEEHPDVIPLALLLGAVRPDLEATVSSVAGHRLRGLATQFERLPIRALGVVGLDDVEMVFRAGCAADEGGKNGGEENERKDEQDARSP